MDPASGGTPSLPMSEDSAAISKKTPATQTTSSPYPASVTASAITSSPTNLKPLPDSHHPRAQDRPTARAKVPPPPAAGNFPATGSARNSDKTTAARTGGWPYDHRLYSFGTLACGRLCPAEELLEDLRSSLLHSLGRSGLAAFPYTGEFPRNALQQSPGDRLRRQPAGS